MVHPVHQSVVERLAAARAGPARRGHRAARARVVRRAGRVGQDDDARRAGRVAGGRRARPGRDHRRRVQQARRRGADRAARRGAGAAGRRGRRRARPDVPRAGSRDARATPASRSTRSSTATSCSASCFPDGHGGRPRSARPRVLAAQARPPGDGGRGRGGPGAWARRARVRGVRAGDRGVGRRRLRRPRRPRAAPAPGATTAVLARWRARLRGLLVDEAQDLDRTQLELALLLAAPGNRVFLVGDDDQTIYGWRLADVRRVLGLAASLPGPPARRPRDELPLPAPGRRACGAARRAQPRAVRQADPRRAEGAPDGSSSRRTADDDVVRAARAMASWPADDSTRAVLPGRTGSCSSAVVAALDLGLPFRAPDLALPIEDARIDGCSTGWRRPTAPAAARGARRRPASRARRGGTTG